MPIKLNHEGAKIVKRGGAKQFENLPSDEANDTLLIMEIMQRAPNMDAEDYQTAFVELRMEYGEDALDAIRRGYVKFELQSSRDMKGPM